MFGVHNRGVDRVNLAARTNLLSLKPGQMRSRTIREQDSVTLKQVSTTKSMRALILVLTLFLSLLSSQACDAAKATGIPLSITVQPGQSWVEYWDFRDCNVSIKNNSYHLDYKSQDIAETLSDLTTSTNYVGYKVRGGAVFNCINDCGQMQGHLLQLTITNSGRKPVAVRVQQSVCWCP